MKELIATYTDKTVKLLAYNVCDCVEYTSSYTIELLDLDTDRIYYSYYEDMDDMFYIVDTIKGRRRA